MNNEVSESGSKEVADSSGARCPTRLPLRLGEKIRGRLWGWLLLSTAEATKYDGAMKQGQGETPEHLGGTGRKWCVPWHSKRVVTIGRGSICSDPPYDRSFSMTFCGPSLYYNHMLKMVRYPISTAGLWFLVLKTMV